MSFAFPDTNVLIYAFSDGAKREAAQIAVERSDLISVQSLNEFANVARRKLGRSWDEVGDALSILKARFPDIAPIDLATHTLGLGIAEQYRLALYESLIVASALRGGCRTLWSEDLQDGLLIAGQLRIVNPFA